MAKKSRNNSDPFAQRESERYEVPTASREFILEFLDKRGTPAFMDDISSELNITHASALEGLRRRLIAMCRDGQLICNRRGAYCLPEKMSLIKGRVLGHKDGYGFVIPESGGDDLYLSSRQMRRVFDGDVVLVRNDGRNFRGKSEAVIVEIVERNTREVVGRFYEEGGVAFVVPDNIRLTQDIMIPEHAINGAKNGQYVTVEVIRQPETRKGPMGHIVEVLGEHMAPGMEIDVAIRTHGVPFRWPEEVEEESAGFEQIVDADGMDYRIDLRDLPLVTIDGEDARDFDDAVYCTTKRSGGWRLYVAIADVSHYVLPGMALDKEAYQRGNSVYFPDHVIPMLPEVLSNGLCSLKPSVDRLCMVCEMTVSSKGKVSGYKFYEATMHSKARLTYTEVGNYLEQPESEVGESFRSKYGKIAGNIEELHRLYMALRGAREERGAIDFETVETRILFDKERKIEQIVPVERNDAHKLIEECMLCANVSAAKLFDKYEIPSLYRVHEGPSAERLENLRAFLGELGLELSGGDKPTTADYQSLCEYVKDRPDATTLQTVMLRSLSQATYQPENKGHFGLGYGAYTHFTSPIRRYPDLLVHRAIRQLIRDGKECRNVLRGENLPEITGKNSYQLTPGDLVVIGEHCSMTERRADDATRDVMSWLKCEYLTQHVGEEFDGIVTAVTAFGLFVELGGLYVEGLVHVSSLRSDYYSFDAPKHRLVGERTGAVYRLGDEVRVQVTRVGLEDRKVDLELLTKKSKGRKKKRRTKRDEILAEWNADFERQQKKKTKARVASSNEADTKPKQGRGKPKKSSGKKVVKNSGLKNSGKPEKSKSVNKKGSSKSKSKAKKGR